MAVRVIILNLIEEDLETVFRGHADVCLSRAAANFRQSKIYAIGRILILEGCFGFMDLMWKLSKLYNLNAWDNLLPACVASLVYIQNPQ